VGKSVINLLAMPLESFEFLIEGSASGPEPFSRFLVDSSTSVRLGVVPPKGGVVPTNTCHFPTAFFASFVSFFDLKISAAVASAISCSV
jgi:hypothetical protein